MNEEVIIPIDPDQKLKINLLEDNFNKKIYLLYGKENLYKVDTNNDFFNDLKKNNFRCEKCKIKISHFNIRFKRPHPKLIPMTQRGGLTKDHIFPKHYGGHLTKYNKQYLCRKCNNIKADNILITFIEQPFTFILAILDTLKYNLMRIICR